MKRSVRLTLKKETLAELAGDDLSGVAGGTVSAGPTCYTCTCRSCVECLLNPTLPAPSCIPGYTNQTLCCPD